MFDTLLHSMIQITPGASSQSVSLDRLAKAAMGISKQLKK
jgi:hypothetical protein